ncbi:MAG: hypothetical protein RML99_08060, partial [Anaerolineae bacterium]|nr:hypothetical protein [Anaerolineae bacterium]
MMTFRSRIPSKLGLALAWLICFALFGLQIALFREFTIDDAFITFRYVKQWVAGNGLVFNIGERVE